MVVDDEALLRSGISAILDTASDIEVVAACTGAQALEHAGAHQPDVVLLDVRMPDVDGLTVLDWLQELPRPPHIAMLTTFDADEYLSQALQRGAAGFLLKDTEPRDLIAAVRALATGGGCLSTPLVRRLTHAGPAAASHADACAAAPQLTALSSREREVLAHLAQGLSNHEIGALLHLSPATVKDHVSALLAKLGVGNRVQAAVLATRASLTAPDTAS
ncbi:DNA-binding response regulator [Streptomyces vinaceus]|uniref:DNA-binding response regulator n=1 Tax=Streptomyces vinaceus TaxID=1960 RepID=A0A5J6JRW3_STRVI|nr:response regulator transcription factor [Streptomyces vinaceus]QEV50288.1 DNA-binding response regulator [Streptomyces vinaceus]